MDDDNSLSSPSEQPLTAAAPPSGGTSSRRRRGPNTAAGKKKVSLNAVTHGLSSARLILPGEHSADWDTHRRAVMDTIAPVGAVEKALAEHVASLLWRLQRLTAYETAAIDERQHLEQLSARLLPHPDTIDRIIRHEAHLVRQLLQLLRELEARQDARHGKPTPLVRVDVNGQTGTLPATEGA